jgi:hypothetical protein
LSEYTRESVPGPVVMPPLALTPDGIAPAAQATGEPTTSLPAEYCALDVQHDA